MERILHSAGPPGERLATKPENPATGGRLPRRAPCRRGLRGPRRECAILPCVKAFALRIRYDWAPVHKGKR